MPDPALIADLREVWQAVLRLPDSEAAFDDLDPAQRRDAHDIGVRIADRLVHTLARLVAGMAEDGADLVDERGLPRTFEDQGPQGDG